MKNNIIYVLLMAISTIAFAKMPLLWSYITTTPDGTYYFKMIIDKNNPDDVKKVIGTCYEIDRWGNENIIWKTKGWYSKNTYLCNDGRHLISIHFASKGKKPSKNDIAVAFYNNGVMFKKYSPLDLVKNKKFILYNDGYYFFSRKINYEYLQRGDYFSLQTVDSINYIFDLRTGDIIPDSAYNTKSVKIE